MPTNRTPIRRRRAARITPEAIEAYRAGDYRALHRALGLRPWEASPLPLSVTALGVDPERPPGKPKGLWEESWPQAVALQKALENALKQ